MLSSFIYLPTILYYKAVVLKLWYEFHWWFGLGLDASWCYPADIYNCVSQLYFRSEFLFSALGGFNMVYFLYPILFNFEPFLSSFDLDLGVVAHGRSNTVFFLTGSV